MPDYIREGKGSCIDAGIHLLRDNLSFKRATPILYKDNLRDISPEDFKVPHSEAAMFTKAAGEDIVAFFASPGLAFIAYGTDDRCGFAYGTINEMLSPNLARRVMSAYFPEYKES